MGLTGHMCKLEWTVIPLSTHCVSVFLSNVGHRWHWVHIDLVVELTDISGSRNWNGRASVLALSIEINSPGELVIKLFQHELIDK